MKDVRVFKDKGVGRGKGGGEGKLKRKGQKVFLGFAYIRKKRVILKNKFERGIFTFKDF